MTAPTASELLQLRARRYEMLKHIKALKAEAEYIKRTLVRASLVRLIAQPSALEEDEDPRSAPCDVRHAATSGWHCPDTRNAFKHCIYNDLEDECHDFCLFCGKPEERQ